MSFSRNAVIIALIIFHPCKKLSVGHLLHHTSIFERLYPQIVLSYIELHTLISNSFFFFCFTDGIYPPDDNCSSISKSSIYCKGSVLS